MNPLEYHGERGEKERQQGGDGKEREKRVHREKIEKERWCGMRGPCFWERLFIYLFSIFNSIRKFLAGHSRCCAFSAAFKGLQMISCLSVCLSVSLYVYNFFRGTLDQL